MAEPFMSTFTHLVNTSRQSWGILGEYDGHVNKRSLGQLLPNECLLAS